MNMISFAFRSEWDAKKFSGAMTKLDIRTSVETNDLLYDTPIACIVDVRPSNSINSKVIARMAHMFNGAYIPSE